MKLSLLPLGLALVLAGAATTVFSQQAQQQGPNLADGGKKDPNEAVRLLDTSGRLLDYGRKNKEPIALILAAQMLQSVRLSELARQPQSEGGGADEGTKAASAEVTVDSILEEARKMSGGDKVIQQMAADVKVAANKGRVGGPAAHRVNVSAGATNWYRNVAFQGGRYAEVAAIGDGDTDLDLYVYDSSGNLICSDTDLSDRTYCGWTPRWTGDFTIKVVNRGRVYNRYTFVTN